MDQVLKQIQTLDTEISNFIIKRATTTNPQLDALAMLADFSILQRCIVCTKKCPRLVEIIKDNIITLTLNHNEYVKNSCEQKFLDQTPYETAFKYCDVYVDSRILNIVSKN